LRNEKDKADGINPGIKSAFHIDIGFCLKDLAFSF